mgnify:FL=1
MENNGNVEKNIVESARNVFVEKGYDGATMREIAAGAGINISMLHYYYRSKDNLFDIVFNDVFNRMYGRIFEVISSGRDIFAKIRTIVDIYLDTLSAEPRLPNFIFNEVTQRPARSGRFSGHKEYILGHIGTFQQQLDEEAQRGTIRRVSVMELFVAMESLCVYPFLTHPLWQKIFDVDQENFTRIIMARRDTYADNIIKSIEK